MRRRFPVGTTVRTLIAVAMVATAGLITPARGGVPAAPSQRAAAAVVPTGFTDRTEISGLNMPSAVAFAPDGRVFVAEKAGIVKVFDSLDDMTPTVFADLRTQVSNFIDRGLLGLALDPQFPARPYVYVLYTYDAEPGGTAPRWNDDCPTPPGATTEGCVVQGRLSRLTAAGDQMVGVEQPLVTGWCQQFPSHSVGSVLFGPDGALYASAGDGAGYNSIDYGQVLNKCGDPPLPAGSALSAPTADGGALRSQSMRRAAGAPAVLNGTIVRVDPDTGAGLPGNPLFSSADQNARRVIAYGMRQPFRFGVRPGTEELWVGDVGWDTWEEINRITDVNDGVMENFGWPCYEGTGRQPSYDSANLTRCESLYSGTQPTAPYYTYRHTSKVLASDACAPGTSAISGIAFEDGSNYPAAYDGAVFFADAARGCIWAMQRGAGAIPNPSLISAFASGAGPVQLVAGPGGDIFYVDIYGGAIHRIVYNGANHPPTAVVSAEPSSGNPPLTVQLDGSESHDLDAGDTLTYAWDLDNDGGFDDAATAATSRAFTTNGAYTVRLRVTDQGGAFDTEAATIVVGPPNAAPVPVIDAPTGAGNWKVGDTIAFSGHATDAEEGTLAANRLSWSLLINHCPSACHVHPMQDFVGVASGSFPAPDHEYPMSLSLVLTATDGSGVKTSTSVQLNPQTVDVTLASVPTGLQLSLATATGAAPLTRRVIVGSSNSVSAPAQLVGGTVYAFESWSDGGAATHNLAPASTTPTTYTARFRPVQPGCPATPSFYNTAPTPTGPPAAASLADGRVVFAAFGADGGYYLAATDASGDAPVAGPLECYGGISAGSPAIAPSPTAVNLFTRTSNNSIYQRTLTAGSTGVWTKLPIGGASADGPSAVVTSGPGGEVVHLVLRGTNGALYHATRTGTTWSAWENLGGAILGSPSIAALPGGGVMIAARSTNNYVYTLSGNSGAWGPWVRLTGQTASSPVLATGFLAGEVEILVTGTGAGGLYQNRLLNGSWGSWLRVDMTVPATARLAAAAAPGRIIVYVTSGGVTTYRYFVGAWLQGKAPYTCATCVPPPGGTGPLF